MRFQILTLTILFSFHFNSGIAQGGVTVITIHEIVGDTISNAERRKFNLFPHITIANFEYGICIVESGEMKIRVYHLDSTSSDFSYDMTKLMMDKDRIVQNQFFVDNRPKSGFKKVTIRLTSLESFKTIKL